ncbi:MULTISPECIES: EAL domain-containing protein [Halomonadaceae]|uniref:bifunctional diguanylate cyclase/phosphodiesterase n=1 Tax=Halomonadaceae TaxID=28256 RepID=UPI00159A5582|nr:MULTISPECIES: EAL domain-containing protein [Halomonas]QJQ96546.1 EAL domain-containing protein [Halomonas sp. PA5]
MTSVVKINNEAQRLVALRQLGLLDTPPEERFDRLTRLAQKFFGVEMALVTLVDIDRQWFKSRLGIDVGQTSRDISFCSHAILGREILEIPDARCDPRFHANPLVIGEPYARFYAGAPLSTREGHRIGTLCLVDSRPRHLTPDELANLRDLADCVEQEINEQHDAQLRHQLHRSEARHNVLIDTASIGTWEWNLQRDELVVNTRWASMLGYGLDELEPLGLRQWQALTHPDDLTSALARLNQHIAGQLDYYDSQFRMRHKGGHWVWIHARGRVSHRDAHDRPTDVIGTHIDITEERSADAAARELLQRLKKLTSNLPGMLYQYQQWPDGHACYPYVSDGVSYLLGVNARALEADASLMKQAIHPEDIARVSAAWLKSESALTPVSEQFRVVHASGEALWTENYSSPERLEDGSILWHGYIVDIHTRKMAEAALIEEARHTQTIIDNMVNGIITIDTNGIIQSFNPAAEELFGYGRDEMVGQDVKRLMPPPYRDAHDNYLHNYQTTGLARIIGTGREVEGMRKDGSKFQLELSISEIKHGDETIYLGMARDISQRKASEEEINRLAFYDPLTLLPNRRLFSDRLKQALAASNRRRTHGALLFIDLDNFKNLNDTAGHDIGDKLLQHVASRLSSCVREGDTVARLGGDEFVIILEGLSDRKEMAASQAELVGEKIRTRLNEPYSLEIRDYQGSPSIGITLFFSHDQIAEELLKQADMAMYEAKAAGRNALYFFDPQMQHAIESRIAMENELRTAIREEQFTLYYQRQVDAAGNVTGAEALLRWEHPYLGMVPPNDFIPLAEEMRLILPIGQWVLRTACRQLATWATRPETHHLTLSVNISALQFAQADFVAEVLSSLELTGANPARLKLELTESLLASNVENVIIKMHALQERSVGFSLDDFGTGYSSLGYLKRLPIEQLKIDQSFVRDLLEDPSDAIIAQTIIALADNMGLGVIAEGVETEAHRLTLANMGCFTYQGYLFGRPMEAKAFEASLQ